MKRPEPTGAYLRHRSRRSFAFFASLRVSKRKWTHAKDAKNAKIRLSEIRDSTHFRGRGGGTHIHVSGKHLPKYLGKFEYRWNMRQVPHLMLDRLMAPFGARRWPRQHCLQKAVETVVGVFSHGAYAQFP
jgi:hypothetical protein